MKYEDEINEILNRQYTIKELYDYDDDNKGYVWG